MNQVHSAPGPARPADAPKAVEARRAPHLVSIAPDGSGRYIAVDEQGEVWRGESKRSRGDGDEEYISWRRMRSELDR